MKFHVAGLLKEAVGATRQHEVDEELGDIDPAIAPAERLRGQVKLTRTNDGILVDADLHLAVHLSCGRCLTDVVVPLDLRFSEQYLPVVDVASGLPLPEPEDRSVFAIDESHVLDVTEAVRQYALLAFPIAPLCKDACAGLCPLCGKDLNQGPCECEPGPIDERWGPLAKYLQGSVNSGSAETKSGKKKRKSERN